MHLLYDISTVAKEMGSHTSDILVGRLKIHQFMHYRSPLPSHDGAPEL